jgi:hypothetical protein
MRNTTKLSIAVLAAAIGFTLSPALGAEEEAPSVAAPQNPGMSDHGPMMMRNEMPGMMKMMEECGRMMQSMNDRRGSTSPDQPQGTPPSR